MEFGQTTIDQVASLASGGISGVPDKSKMCSKYY